MIGKLKIVTALACALLLGVLTCGCAPSVDAKNFTGAWEFLYGSQEGLNKEEIDMAKSLGSNAVMTLNEDGTGTLDLFGDVTNLTWVATNDTDGSVTVEGSNAASMNVKDDQLILSDSSDRTLTFGRAASD